MIKKAFLSITLVLCSFYHSSASALYIDSSGHTILDFAEYSSFQNIAEYGEVNWSNTLAISSSGFGVDDDNAGLNSIPFLGGIVMSSTSSDGFSLNDAYFKSYFDTSITVSGITVDGDIVSKDFSLSSADGWTNVNFEFFGVDSLTLSSTTGTQFFVDNVDVSEPTSLAILGLGLLGFAMGRKKAK